MKKLFYLLFTFAVFIMLILVYVLFVLNYISDSIYWVFLAAAFIGSVIVQKKGPGAKSQKK